MRKRVRCMYMHICIYIHIHTYASTKTYICAWCASARRRELINKPTLLKHSPLYVPHAPATRYADHYAAMCCEVLSYYYIQYYIIIII